ncbi:putative sulfate exporter family transporter [Kitasatospora sp. DSM 101779]|uniref:putative sulfate exporter family transporter n=1 Tax=Kitasatospora sp. DSM 101779 TaxID=2853165 RepID=UPI0029554531|nr:putative sulfate exporter family transporter [Kitasatospora sp. DSM 101779]MCU7820857.1 putative sulfate exporter family transporter [Kitasatospora sp. DSM 101779]
MLAAILSPASRRVRSASAPATSRSSSLTRTLMIIPICTLVPGFLLAFLGVAAANTAGLVPAGARHGLGELSVFLITVALSAIGLSTDLGGLRRAGSRPLILGACLWIVVSATGLGLQRLTGTL